MSNNAHNNIGAAATAAKTHAINNISIHTLRGNCYACTDNRVLDLDRPIIELAFAGRPLGLKAGDVVAASKDGVTAAFKLGHRLRFKTVRGADGVTTTIKRGYNFREGADKPKSRQVFVAQPVNMPFYYLMALFKDEPLFYFDKHVFLTAAAAVAGIEQTKEEEAKRHRLPVFDSIGVVEVSPGMRSLDEAKRVLPEPGQAAAKTLAVSAKRPTKAGRRRVAGNPATPGETLAGLTKDRDETVRLTAASNPSCPPACLVPREKIIQTSLAGAERVMIFNAAAGSGRGQLIRTLAAEPGVAICAPTSAVAGSLALDGIKALTPARLLSDRRSLAEIKVLVIAESSLLDASQLERFAEIPKLILFP